MKVRTDYVSNSSSSSFIVACADGYLEKILKDVAKACEDKKSQWHDYGLVKRNFRILDFCVNTFQLLFLGSLKLDTKIEKLKIDDFKKQYVGDDLKDENMKKVCESQAESFWNDFKKHIKQAKKSNCDEWIKREYGRDSYDKVNDEITHVKDIIAERIVVSNDVMTNTFRRYHFKDAVGNEYPQSEEDIKSRVESIVEFSKKHTLDESYFDETCHASDIYQITQDTIDNTRDLIAAGHKIIFDDWEDLDKLEKKIKDGDIVFALRVARDGDGYGDFYIYTEKSSGCIDEVSGLEIVGWLD